MAHRTGKGAGDGVDGMEGGMGGKLNHLLVYLGRYYVAGTKENTKTIKSQTEGHGPMPPPPTPLGCSIAFVGLLVKERIL